MFAPAAGVTWNGPNVTCVPPKTAYFATWPTAVVKKVMWGFCGFVGSGVALKPADRSAIVLAVRGQASAA
jgi:hypothetical protein